MAIFKVTEYIEPDYGKNYNEETYYYEAESINSLISRKFSGIDIVFCEENKAKLKKYYRMDESAKVIHIVEIEPILIKESNENL